MKIGHASRREENGSTRIDAGSLTDVHSGGYGSQLTARSIINTALSPNSQG